MLHLNISSKITHSRVRGCKILKANASETSPLNITMAPFRTSSLPSFFNRRTALLSGKSMVSNAFIGKQNAKAKNTTNNGGDCNIFQLFFVRKNWIFIYLVIVKSFFAIFFKENHMPLIKKKRPFKLLSLNVFFYCFASKY